MNSLNKAAAKAEEKAKAPKPEESPAPSMGATCPECGRGHDDKVDPNSNMGKFFKSTRDAFNK